MFEAEVALGAQWLDFRYPGWEKDIDLSNLDMKDCRMCIIGQAIWNKVKTDALHCGSAKRLFNDLGSNEWHAMLGFSLLTDGQWEELEKTWEALIKERFNSGTLS